MIFLQQLLPIIIYFLLIILLITGIILFVRLINTLNKVDKVVDDVSKKVESLNGFFNIMDFVTDKIVSLGDRLINFTFNAGSKLFKRKNKTMKKEKENE